MSTQKRRDRDSDGDAKSDDNKRQKQSDLFGYSNENNPFGDSKLTEQFNWKLKDRESKEKKQKRKEHQHSRREELVREIEKVRERREERDRERELRQQEKMKEAREREAANWVEWERKEAEFHLKQAQKRSEIRIKEGRAKPIDIIYKNLQLDHKFDFDDQEPFHIFEDLLKDEVIELKKDIAMYRRLDSGDEMHQQFWDALMVVCDDELETLQFEEKMKFHPNARQTGVHHSVLADINKLLEDKSAAELKELQQQIQAMLSSGVTMDAEYWETMAKKTKVACAKSKLSEVHKFLLEKRLERLEQLKKEDKLDYAGLSSLSKTNTEADPFAVQSSSSLLNMTPAEQERLKKQGFEDEARRLEEKARKLQGPSTQVLTEDALFQREKEKPMGEDEEQFSEELALPNVEYNWDDKYRPRKPRYFNRIHTGYDWNKYNQTHYDHENPPPKTIMGYKFNVFYPDLIDKSTTPQFFKTRDPDKPDMCILRFHAGPPYEDIAFRILDREWEFGHRRGYRCSFDRGVLSVWFHFKRYKYRR